MVVEIVIDEDILKLCRRLTLLIMCSLIARETDSLHGEREALVEALQRHYSLNSHSIAYLATSVNSFAHEHS
jgi:hypothetical protein